MPSENLTVTRHRCALRTPLSAGTLTCPPLGLLSYQRTYEVLYIEYHEHEQLGVSAVNTGARSAQRGEGRGPADDDAAGRSPEQGQFMCMRAWAALPEHGVNVG